MAMNWILKFLLKRAGWKAPDPSMIPWDTYKKFKVFPAAEQVFRVFNGLELEGSGLLFGSSCIQIRVSIDELGQMHESIMHRNRVLGVELLPVGLVDYGMGTLLLDDIGKVYLDRGHWEGLLLVSSNFEGALLRLMLNLPFERVRKIKKK